MNSLTWGIVGSGHIAGVFSTGLRMTGAGRVVFVYGRTEQQVEDFCNEYGGGIADSLDVMLEDSEVEAIYVATPHLTHPEFVRAALDAGRTVLCEKPMAPDAATTRALFEHAEQANRVLREGYAYRHHPQIDSVLDGLASGRVGTPARLEARYGFVAPTGDDTRWAAPSLGGGCILDSGGDLISLACALAGSSTAEIERAAAERDANGVDLRATATLRFDNGFEAQLECALDRELDRHAIVEGDAGTLRIDDPFVQGDRSEDARLATEATLHWGDVTETVAAERDCFSLQAQDLAERAKNSDHASRPTVVTPAQSIAIAGLRDAWRAQAGLD